MRVVILTGRYGTHISEESHFQPNGIPDIKKMDLHQMFLLILKLQSIRNWMQ